MAANSDVWGAFLQRNGVITQVSACFELWNGLKAFFVFRRPWEDSSDISHLLSPICTQLVSTHSVTEESSKSDRGLFVRPLPNFTLFRVLIKGGWGGGQQVHVLLCVSLPAALPEPVPNASAPSHDNPAAAPAEVRDHLILYSQTRLVINRLHLIRNTEEQGLSVYRWALLTFLPAPSSASLSCHSNTVIAKIRGFKCSATVCIRWKEENLHCAVLA